MSVEWPASLPLPQFGLRYNVADPQMRAQMASGRTISRRRFSDVPTEFSARWILRQSEAEIFEQFYQNDAVDGSEWIEMPLVTAQGEGVHYVRFRGAYQYRRVGADLWEYSANLQMYLRPGSPEWPPGAGGGPGPDPEPIIWGPMSQFLIDGSYSVGDVDDIHHAGGSSWLAVLRLQYSGTTHLHIVRSANDGVSWSTVLTIPDYAGPRNKLVTDWTGDWFLGRDAYSSALFETFTYVSSTNGVTWEKVNMPNAGDIGGRFSHAATNGGGIWLNVAENSRSPLLVKRSTDGGRTWATLSPSPAPGGADAVQFLEASRTGAFILAKPGASGAPGVYKTVDGGNSWQFLTNHVMRVAATNHIGMWVAASGPNEVLISTDDGDSWVSVPTPDIDATGLATSIATDENGRWVIGYEDGSAAVSYDNAETWGMFVQGLNSGSGSSNRVSTITTSGAQKWMAGFYGGFAAISPPLE